MSKNKYNPELGHVIFHSNNIQSTECPDYVVALLRDINRVLCIKMWNKNQIEYDSPFENTGNVEGFKNDVFEVHAFDWNEDTEQSFNFKYKDIEISWYKYLGRDTSINKEITFDEIIDMYGDCLDSLKWVDEDV